MSNFTIGDKVTYGIHGLCELTDIKEMLFAGKVEKYYVLTPISDNRSTVFVPCDNGILVARMKRLLRKSEILTLIKNTPISKDILKTTLSAKEHSV